MHPRISENLFPRYVREREKHPGYECACLAREISMLHGNVLMLLRLFVIASRGVVLGIGAHRRVTIVLGATEGSSRRVCNQHRTSAKHLGAQGSLHRRRAQPTPSADIFFDLVRNVSYDPKVVESVNQARG